MRCDGRSMLPPPLVRYPRADVAWERTTEGRLNIWCRHLARLCGTILTCPSLLLRGPCRQVHCGLGRVVAPAVALYSSPSSIGADSDRCVTDRSKTFHHHPCTSCVAHPHSAASHPILTDILRPYCVHAAGSILEKGPVLLLHHLQAVSGQGSP